MAGNGGAELMIKCPRTGQDISTGILTDPASYQKIPETLAYTRCPHCGLEHAWWHNDAWLAAEGPSQCASKVEAAGRVNVRFQEREKGGDI